MVTSDPSAENSDGRGADPGPAERTQPAGGTGGRAGVGATRQARPPAVVPHHPAVLAQQAERAQDIQIRIADWITAFAGSMNFVYLHIALFTIWMLFLERSPWPTLTLVVSLEAIFLSTFVMIGQNRQAAFQQAKADHDFTEQELELKTNTELTRDIDRLTTELHSRLLSAGTSGSSPPAS
jgi:low affinity Fe/Cu permease